MATISIDVIKMRQTQDKNGHVLMLRLNPADEVGVAAVSLAPCGAQFKMELSDLDENGNPPDAGEVLCGAPAREVGETPAQSGTGLQTPASRLNAGAVSSPDREAVSKVAPTTAPASRLTQMACICCNDSEFFWPYLSKRGHSVANKDQARDAIYEECKVKSRKEFIQGTPAGDRWLKFYDKFALWKEFPE